MHIIEYCLAKKKKGGGTDVCFNMNKLWNHYAKWNKWVKKEHMLYDSTSITCAQYANQ